MDNVDGVLNSIGIGKFNFFILFAMGLIQMCNSADVWILATISILIGCDWRISITEMSFLSSSVLIGLIIGGPLMGLMADKYGRKPSLMLGNVGLFYFSMILSISNSYPWMVIMRLCIGVFHGINSLANFTIISEINPVKYRGTFMVLLQVFWALGSFYITALSFFIIPRFGWRTFLIISSFEFVFVLIALIWMPESPRFLISQNRKQEFLQVVNTIAKWNGSQYIDDIKSSQVVKYSPRELFHHNYLLTTVFTSFLGLVGGLNYYGIVILVTVINGTPHHCLQDWKSFSQVNVHSNVDDSCCSELNWETHRHSFISAVGEIIFVPISIVLINLIGRKNTMAFYFFIIFLGLLLLNLCLEQLNLSILLLFIRGAMKSVLNVTQLYTSEVFPLSVRGFGIGVWGAFSKFGGIISPFIVHMLIEKYSFITGTVIMFSLNITAVICSLLLPYETNGRPLYETADHDITENDKIFSKDQNNYQTMQKN